MMAVFKFETQTQCSMALLKRCLTPGCHFRQAKKGLQRGVLALSDHLFLLYNTIVFIYNNDNARFCCGCCLGGNLTKVEGHKDPQWKATSARECSTLAKAKAKAKAMPRQKSLWQRQRQRQRHWPYAKTKAKEKATGKGQNM